MRVPVCSYPSAASCRSDCSEWSTEMHLSRWSSPEVVAFGRVSVMAVFGFRFAAPKYEAESETNSDNTGDPHRGGVLVDRTVIATGIIFG